MNRRGGDRRVRAQRWYRLIVRLYPAAHRRAFGEEMVQMFGDHYRDVVGKGRVSRWRFWRSAVADAGRSLATEHVAAVRARRRPVFARLPRRSARYRPSGRRRTRVMWRSRRHRLVYRGRTLPALVLLAVLIGAAATTGTATGQLGVAALVAGVVALAWLAYRIRLTRLVPAGRRGDGPAPPGGAAVREPRRPLPMSPAGSAARPRHDEEPPGQAVRLIS